MPRTARAMGAPNRLFRRGGIPHPPRDFPSPPPHRRKEGKILEPDRSCANRTGHLDVLTIPVKISIDKVKPVVVVFFVTLASQPRLVGAAVPGCRSSRFLRAQIFGPCPSVSHCALAQKRLSVSPLPATLTHSLSRNPFVCHSYAHTS